MITKPFLRISLVLFVMASLLFLPRFSYAEPPLNNDNKITGQWDLNLTLKCTNFIDSPKRTFAINLKKEKINLTWNEPSNVQDNYVPGFVMMANFTTPKPTGSFTMQGELFFDFPYNFENAGQCADPKVECFDGVSRLMDGNLLVENVTSGKFTGQCKLNLQGYWKKFSDSIPKRNKIKGWSEGFCWEDNTVDTPAVPKNTFVGMCDGTWGARHSP